MSISHTYKRSLFAVCTVFFLLVCTALSAHAHFPWINLEDGAIATGKELKWSVGWGHRFPLAGFMKGEDVAEMLVLGPDGNTKIEAASASELEFKSSQGLSKPGAYIVAGKRKVGFYTRTTEGSKSQSKKGLSNVISCSRSNSFMKSIANVDTATGKVDTVVGHAMEIVPLVNPASLRVGDYLPIRVMLKGKPYNGEFLASYGGLSTENGVFAYAAGTDKEGLGKVRILHSGVWLIKVDFKEPFADLSECDVESYMANLTFEVP